MISKFCANIQVYYGEFLLAQWVLERAPWNAYHSGLAFLNKDTGEKCCLVKFSCFSRACRKKLNNFDEAGLLRIFLDGKLCWEFSQ